jgi:gluconolactonase
MKSLFPITLLIALSACTPGEVNIPQGQLLEEPRTVLDLNINSKIEEQHPSQNQPEYDFLDPQPNIDPMVYAGEVEEIAKGFWFVEGPVWTDDDTLLFSDIPANKVYQIKEGELSIFKNRSESSNGLTLDNNGSIVAAQHGTRSISKIEHGESTVIVDRFEGNRLNSPNDLVYHSNGSLFFTDPPYGIEDDQRELPQNHVFHYTPSEGATSIWAGESWTRPNGVALSMDERTLYVSYTHEAVVRAFPINEQGEVEEGEIFAHVSSVADGMTVDPFGNLYVTTVAGIEVLNPEGELWGTLSIPNQPSNCTFGGEDQNTLYITAVNAVYAIPFSW